MNTILRLIDRLADVERGMTRSTFIAPHLPGSRVRVRVAGLVQSYDVAPRDFEGIGIFAPLDARRARLVEEASPGAVARYMARLTMIRMIPVAPAGGRTWSAVAAGEPDAGRLGTRAPVRVHLVEGIERFDRIIARWDGVSCWFDSIDRRDDPRVAEGLRSALARSVQATELAVSGATMEQRLAYTLAASPDDAVPEAAPAREIERLLRRSLAAGGGTLAGWSDRGDSWVVRWRTSDGDTIVSLVAKRDLTVVSAGICLSDRDEEFDLRSLVGVVEDRPDWMRGDERRTWR